MEGLLERWKTFMDPWERTQSNELSDDKGGVGEGARRGETFSQLASNASVH